MPKKFNLIILSSYKIICSFLKDVTPTVSAFSFISFFPPTLNAKLSIKYNAVASCFLLISSLFISLLYNILILFILFFKFFARSNFAISLFDLNIDSIDVKTYLFLLLILSTHVASHTTILLLIISFHFPGTFGLGIGAVLL